MRQAEPVVEQPLLIHCFAHRKYDFIHDINRVTHIIPTFYPLNRRLSPMNKSNSLLLSVDIHDAQAVTPNLSTAHPQN